jgi:hypothetical protein
MLYSYKLSSNAGSFNQADAMVVSVPKSGRAWLRVLLSKCLAELKAQQPELFAASAVRKVKYTHGICEHRSAARSYDRLRGKWLMPTASRLRKPKVLLVRDLHDLMVSLYFQLTKRSEDFTGALSELLVDNKFGAEKVVQTMNAWYREWQAMDNFLLVRYEDAKADDAATFRRFLEFLHVKLGDAVFQQSLRYSKFDNTKQIEKNGGLERDIDSAIGDVALAAGRADDPESYKVCKGMVGNYKEYMSDADLAVVAEAMGKLEPVIGYVLDQGRTK